MVNVGWRYASSNNACVVMCLLEMLKDNNAVSRPRALFIIIVIFAGGCKEVWEN